MLGNDTDAADAAQEALIAVVRGLDHFDRRSRFSTWTYRVAVNASLDELRRRRRRPVSVDTADPLSVAHRPDASPAVDRAVGDRIDVDAALARLPVEFRVAVVLRDLCGLDYAEIAEVLDIPPGTVRSRIARGRAALAPLLSPDVDPEPRGNRPRSTERRTPT